MNEPNDKFIKIDEVCTIVGIGKTKVIELVKEEKFILPIKIDGFSTTLYSHLELQGWMEEQKQRRKKTLP